MTLREYFDPNAIRLCVFRAAELRIVSGNMVAQSETPAGRTRGRVSRALGYRYVFRE